VLQDWNTNDMIFDVPALIEFLSGSTTAAARNCDSYRHAPRVGAARTPRRWLRSGIGVSIEIEEIGTLTNPVLDETP
jgi:2-keto-4-pentenoate hydratase/2-oxohepta-3-ene-1,7-dioic acid hydratase in catechol pathway